ncbi:hypothetical protein NB693_25180 [Pantoea ananatis]|uniref:hypothetical protein n=1 Tax=Pantoea ananas TaxID=553 RepID=UPI00221F860A|nr:hypothetical protein [Pantoea ananatis]
MINYRVHDLHALVAALREEGCHVLDRIDESEWALGALALLAWQLSELLLIVFGAVVVGVLLHGLATLLRKWLPLPEWALALVILVLRCTCCRATAADEALTAAARRCALGP